MKTDRAVAVVNLVLGLVTVLCLDVGCDLQGNKQEDKSTPSLGAFRLMAYGDGRIAVTVGLYGPSSEVSVDSWGEPSFDCWNGGWQKELREQDVLDRKGEARLMGLFLRANIASAGGTALTTRIVRVDAQGNEIGTVENSIPTTEFSPATCTCMMYLWELPPQPPPSPPAEPPHQYKVICAELHRRGLMEQAIFEADERFGDYLHRCQPDVLRGYRWWARPVVEWMRSSPPVTSVVAAMARPWACEMAYRMGARAEGSFLGSVLMDVGVPVCRLIGRTVARTPDAAEEEGRK